MFLAGHPSQACFGLQSHCAPCYFFDKASFYPSDFSFKEYCTNLHGDIVKVLRDVGGGYRFRIECSKIDRNGSIIFRSGNSSDQGVANSDDPPPCTQSEQFMNLAKSFGTEEEAKYKVEFKKMLAEYDDEEKQKMKVRN
ncbi:hypothetical protein TNCV_4387141 [Trichonephila clavipes]|nr:hypothetical protein TNCV_4387141 [Trichonephila clavipes]